MTKIIELTVEEHAALAAAVKTTLEEIEENREFFPGDELFKECVLALKSVLVKLECELFKECVLALKSVLVKLECDDK